MVDKHLSSAVGNSDTYCCLFRLLHYKQAHTLLNGTSRGFLSPFKQKPGWNFQESIRRFFRTVSN
jgi:hypothetical protein